MAKKLYDEVSNELMKNKIVDVLFFILIEYKVISLPNNFNRQI